MAAKKKGRPTTNPKPNRRCYRLSDSDMEKLNYCMRRTGMSEAEVIRKGLNTFYEQLIGIVEDEK